MDLILCHTTADFDTLGAALGMTLLYPGARLVLAGAESPSLRRFLALHRELYGLIEGGAVDPREIERLILVDARCRDRFGLAADWLDLPQLKAILIYDHHLEGTCDIPAQRLQVEPVGATTTLVVEQLQSCRIEALEIKTPDSGIATAMALGIHRATGSLTSDQATPRDAQALAWLMAQGVNPAALRSALALDSGALDSGVLDSGVLDSGAVARDLMSSPVRTIRPDTTIAAAQRLLLRYGHSGVCVVNEVDELVGIISRRDLELALHHGFSQASVQGHMARQLKTIGPETALPEIEQLMVTYDLGRLPVLRDRQLIGIVTRTDVLRTHCGLRDQQLAIAQGQTSRSPNQQPQKHHLKHHLKQRLKQQLHPELWQLLETAAQAAAAQGWHLYLVGGGVRDLLLAAPDQRLQLSDIDLIVDGCQQSVTEAAGVQLAQALQRQYPEARLEIHGKFQTAALLWHRDGRFGNLGLDIATARTEFYPYPAANPMVEASSIRQDLYRRDFTINSLALQLTEPGELLDYFGGLLDLGDRQIRVLHANSFIEDPTRIYRAVRFALRLGFELEAQTRAYMTYALDSGVYDRTQAENPITPALQTRLRSELEHILTSPNWQPALKLLGELDALKCIHNSLKLTPQLWRRIRLVDRALAEAIQPSTAAPPTPWLLRLEILLADLAPALRGEIARKLQLPADSIDRLGQLATHQQQVSQQLSQAEQPSQVCAALCVIDLPSLILIAAATELPQRRQLWCYLTVWMGVKSPLDGNDLKQLGYKPGKAFKLMLEALQGAALDGEIARGEAGRTGAIAWLQRHYPLSPSPLETPQEQGL